MSRSIHVTRRTLQELKRFDFADAAERQARMRRARESLRRKRRIKWQVREERHEDQAGVPGNPTHPGDIPIFTRPSGPFMHYPAGETDLREVMALLPPGALDGVHQIVLEPGVEYLREQQEESDDPDGYESDPLTGRPGIEVLPGVYCGPVLGTYDLGTATIALYGYVYDRAAMPDLEVRELYLRLCMLSTLLHELAHHVDRTTRVARGRWLCIPGDTAEKFAHQNEYAWTRQYAAPYLQQRYPEAARAFEEWTAHHGGVRIPFELVAQTVHPLLLNVGGAYEWLAEAVARGEPLQATRLGFAEELRYAERYDEALQSVELVLAEHPGDTAALTAKALILERLERYEEAEQFASTALANDTGYLDAWDVLVDVFRATGQWERLEPAATQVLLLDSTWWQKQFALADRAAARIELGEFAAAEIDIDELSGQRGKWPPRRAAVLRAVLLLRQGQHEAALACATELLQSANRRRSVEPELLATRLEASHALGTLKPDLRLSDDDLARLRRRGYAEWAQRIVAIQQAVGATERPKRGLINVSSG